MTDQEDTFVYIPQKYNNFNNEYESIRTKAGNSLHKTETQARQKLVQRSSVYPPDSYMVGRICKYKLVLVEEIIVGEENG